MLTKLRKVQSTKISYVNCDFILGSVSIVNRLWSFAHYIYSDYRRSMALYLSSHFCFSLRTSVFGMLNWKVWLFMTPKVIEQSRGQKRMTHMSKLMHSDL